MNNIYHSGSFAAMKTALVMGQVLILTGCVHVEQITDSAAGSACGG